MRAALGDASIVVRCVPKTAQARYASCGRRSAGEVREGVREDLRKQRYYSSRKTYAKQLRSRRDCSRSKLRLWSWHSLAV